MSTNPAQSHLEDDYMSLMKGIKELDCNGPYIPNDLVLIGGSFPLAMTSKGQVVMAASQYGRGRIVVLGHEGYLTTFRTLVENALTWLKGDGSDNLSVGVHMKVKAVADNLRASRFQPKVVGAFSTDLNVGVYVTDAYSVGTEAKDLVAFLKAGGGVLIGGQAWHWAACNPKKNTLLCFPGNKFSAVAGIYFSKNRAAVECLTVCPKIPSSWRTTEIVKDFVDDLEFLLKGVSKFDLQGDLLWSEILVHGPLAFPIGTTQDAKVFLAGAYYGQGRVIVAGHEKLTAREELAPFLNNAMKWLDQDRQGVIGVTPQLPGAFNLLSKSGLQCKKTNFSEDLSVFVCKAYSDAQIEEIQDFVAEGGGLLIGGQAWYWAQSGQNPMTNFPGNKILNKMGLSLEHKPEGVGSYKVPVPSEAIKEGNHFQRLLHHCADDVLPKDELTDDDVELLQKLSVDCSNFLHMKAHDCITYHQVVSNLTDTLEKSGLPQVCDGSPTKNEKERLLLHLGTEVYKVCPDPDALLPYLIKDNPEMPVVRDQRVKLNVKTAEKKDWVSTGLYLSPGMKTCITIPDEMVNKGWKVQIGCHTDFLKAEELKRAPCVHDQFPLTEKKVEVRNLWGGLIYVVAPPNTQVEGAEVTVQKAISAPYFKSGVTTPDDWSLSRNAPAPWAELEFENVIITVPSKFVRNLDYPDKLAELWDKMMKSIADLAVIEQKFSRKERFVTDVQISAGWMHAGYPIMAHSPVAKDLVNSDSTTARWGFIHELGHNQQRACWEFPPHTTECTCNLWSVYVHEEVLGINRAKAHHEMKLENRKSRTKEYVKGGRNLDSWEMWVALETYIQLQETFGWDAFKKVFAAYHKMNDFPKDNKGKMNLYAETFSQAVGKNLTGFFKAWGWPIEPATEEKLSNLPPWSDHPMVEYD